MDLSTASGSFYDTSASVDLKHFAMFPVWQTVKEFPLRALEKDLFFLSQSAFSSIADSYPYLVKLFTNWQRKLYWIDNRSTMFTARFGSWPWTFRVEHLFSIMELTDRPRKLDHIITYKFFYFLRVELLETVYTISCQNHGSLHVSRNLHSSFSRN